MTTNENQSTERDTLTTSDQALINSAVFLQRDIALLQRRVNQTLAPLCKRAIADAQKGHMGFIHDLLVRLPHGVHRSELRTFLNEMARAAGERDTVFGRFKS